MSFSVNLQNEDTALGSIAIYQVVMNENYPNMIDFGDIQPSLIIDGSIYLILWKLDLPTKRREIGARSWDSAKRHVIKMINLDQEV